MEIKRNVRKVAELGIAVTAIAALLVAGCGGGGALGLGGGGSSIVIAGAGNSPFIGVTMKAECANANGTTGTGTGVIGTDAAPGDGTISVAGTCTAPIKITATGKGKMRPIGASGVTQDVDYDPAVNLPITNILTTPPAPGVSFTANPVTTLVANRLFAGASVSAVLANYAASSVAMNVDVTAAQTSVATALGITATAGATPVSQMNDGYLNAKIAEASDRIVRVAALAVNQVTSTGVMPPGVDATKSLGQYVAEKITAAGTAGKDLSTANALATSLNTTDNLLNVTASSAVAVNGSIDTDAKAVNAMITIANNAATQGGTVLGNKPKTLNELFVAIGSVTGAASGVSVADAANMLQCKQSHVTQAAKDSVKNAASKMVADVAITISATSGVTVQERTTKLTVTQAAATKMIADMDSRLNSIAAGTAASGVTMAKVMQAAKVISDGVTETIKQDLKATSKVFDMPSTVGASSVAAALVGDLEDTAKNLTVTQTFDPLANAVTALKFASAVSGMSAPSASNQIAFDAALAAVVTRMDPLAPPPTPGQLQAVVNAVEVPLAAGITTAGATAGAPEAEEAALTALNAAVSPTTAINFATPPTVGAITVLAAPLAPTTITVAPVVDQVAIAIATAAATAAQNQAVTYAAQAATAQSAAAAAYTQTVALSTTAATTVGPAQTAANAAQAAATAAHTARVAADAAAAAAAAAFPNSTQATAAAAAASNAASADAAATASASAAKACYDGLVARLLAAQLAAAQADATHAAGDATAAATQAALAASASASAVAATTTTAAQSFAATAATAATAAQTAATHAAADAADAAIQLPGSPPATAVAAAATSATAAQASANAAKASSAAAAAAATPVGAPTAVAATAGNASATVSFTAPAGTIIDYRVLSNPGNISMVGMASPIVVTGLTNGTAYTFTVTATTAKGTSAPSSASAAVTPAAAPPALSLAATATITDTLIRVGVDAAPKSTSVGVDYTGATLAFGPYTVTGLSAPASVTMLSPFVGYQTMSVNGGTALATAQAVSNGNTITVYVNLAQYVSASGGGFGPLGYGNYLFPKIKAGTTVTITFGSSATVSGIQTCTDPTLTPSPGFVQCQ